MHRKHFDLKTILIEEEAPYMCVSTCPKPEVPSDDQIHLFMQTFRSLNMAMRPNPRSLHAATQHGHNRIHPRPKAFFVMHFLHHQHARGEKLVRLSDVGADLQLAPPTVTLMLNDLEKDGYVERVRDNRDRRVVRVRLTTNGAQILDAMYQNSKKQIEHLVKCLGQQDALQLLDLMQRAVICLQDSKNQEGGSSDAQTS